MVDEVMPDQPVLPRRRPPFTRRQILAQVGVAAVILISGIGIGTGGTILTLKDRNWRPPLPPMGDWSALVERWRTDLGLTDVQAQQIGDLLTKRSTAARKRWEEISKLEQTERDAFAKSMKGILTAEQYTKWQEEFKEHAKRLQERWPGGPDGRRGRGGPGMPDGPGGFRDRRGPDGGRSGGPRGERRPNRPPGPPPEQGPDFRPPDVPQGLEPNAPAPNDDPNSGASV